MLPDWYETVPRSFNWNHSTEPFDILFYNGTRDNLSTKPSITEQQCAWGNASPCYLSKAPYDSTSARNAIASLPASQQL